MNDILQYKRKLQNPYLRRWHHGKGDDTYTQKRATKKMIEKALKSKRESYIAYGGKEYTVNEFLVKNPKFKLKRR